MPKNIDIANRLTNILDAENITYSNGYIIELIKKYGTDIRKMINESQKLSASHEVLSEDVLLDQFSSKYNEFFDKMFSSKDAKKISDLAKKMLFDEDIYTALKDYVIAKYNNMDAVIIIADHAYKSRIVMDKDLVFLSCIFNLMEVMK